MATANPFDLLGNDENDDPTQLIAAAQQQKLAQPKKPQAPAKVIAAATAPKLPSRPLPPSQAVREEKNETRRGGGPGGRGSGYGGRGNGFGGRGDGFGGRGDGYGGRGRGRDREHGGGGFNRDSSTGDKAFNGNNEFSGGYRAFEDGDNSGRPSDKRNEGPHSSIRGGRRGGYSNGEAAEGDRNRRVYERRSGTGRGSGIKRDGAGRGNWGTPTDEISPDAEEFVNENEKIATAEKVFGEENVADASKDNPENEHEQKEHKAEDKEMTLEEYEKLLQEKRKVLQSLKTEERKVDVDKEFGSMQQLSSKKDGVDIFIKLGSEKDKRKEAADKEDRVKKAVSINEFLKPAEGERLYGNTGRGRGRGQGRGRGEPSGGYPSNNVAAAPAIEDPRQFPSLSGK